MKKIIIDIDNTITINSSSKNYQDKMPNFDLIKKMREYKDAGFEIILFTARNMNTYDGEISKINKHTAPILLKWLSKYDIPYDGLIFGKPWCGESGFYVDDKSIRPNEFVNLSYKEIQKLIS